MFGFCGPLGVLLALILVYTLKFEGGTMMVMIPRQYFELSNCVGPAVQLNPGTCHLR